MSAKQKRREARRRTRPDLITRMYAGELHRADDGAIVLTMSTETPCPGNFAAREVLVHQADAVDLARANQRGLPVTTEHTHPGSSAATVIGRARPLTLEGKALRAPVEFSERKQAAAVRSDIDAGILTDCSIEASIDLRHSIVQADDTLLHKRWTPKAVALVPIGADPNATIDRATVARIRREIPMSDEIENEGEETLADTRRELAVRQLLDAVPNHAAGRALVQRALTEEWTETRARNALLELLGRTGDGTGAGAGEGDDTGPAAGAGAIQGGEDETAKLQRALEDAVQIRSGSAPADVITRAPENPWCGSKLIDMARSWYKRTGVDVTAMDDGKVAQYILQRAIDPGTAQYDTTDFTEILENVLNKQLFRGFDEAPVTWSEWCGTRDVADFKAFTAPRLSQFSSLPVVAENAQLQNLTQADQKEGGQLVNYGGKHSLTWQAMLNDDLSAFGDQAMRLGEAANRTIDENVYALLVSNTGAGPAMNDTNNLFDSANHANVITTGGAPSEAEVKAIQDLMGRQTDDNSILLGIMPQIAVVPHLLRNAAQKVAVSLTLPDSNGGDEPNAVANTFRVVGSARLTAELEAATTLPATAEAWYMTSRPGESIVVAFLNGQRRPLIRRDEGWSVLSAHWSVVMPHDVYATDWRGIVINHGGTLPS